MPEFELRICSLYPQHMSIYADRGNIMFLERRCLWRGIKFSHSQIGLGEKIDPAEHDLFYMGGGQDRDQRLVADDMVDTKRESLKDAMEDGAVILAVCGGFQLLGQNYQLDRETLPGLGLVDIETVRETGKRLIGNVAIEVDIDGEKRIVAGFENHGGRTYLAPVERPFGHVLKGHGNNGKDGTEGVRRANLIGTYLHGPLLPKNAWLADYLVELALCHRAGGPVRLAELDDGLEDAVHRVARRVAGRG